MFNVGIPKVGIDAIAFYTSQYTLSLATLARERGVDANKFTQGLGQLNMSVPPPDEDIVTLAANAAAEVLADMDRNDIEILLFATESGIDQSKAAGIYVHDLLNLSSRCRVIELKQACYSATFAIQMAMPFLQQNPSKKVLLIAADIARYGLGSVGESSQGAGAVAMVLSANPRILALEAEYGVVTENVMDFWRPNYADNAFVDGKYSSKLYLNMLEKTWLQYTALSQRNFNDHEFFCYHAPVPRLVEKAHHHLARVAGLDKLSASTIEHQIGASLVYARQIGNSYAASLYMGLISLLDLTASDYAGKRIGFYSYGSGCVAEFFSGMLQEGYKTGLHTAYHQALLANRTELNFSQYEAFYSFEYPKDGSCCTIPKHNTGHFRLAEINQHKRLYEKI